MNGKSRKGRGGCRRQAKKKEAESVANERNMGGVACGWKVVGGEPAHRWKWWCALEVLSGPVGRKKETSQHGFSFR